MDKLTGHAVCFGKNIDTDQIYPGRFLDEIDHKIIGGHCFADYSDEVHRALHGCVIVAGTNFGCGSSREHAIISLINAGVKGVTAKSFARIFFRNAINLGFPLIICPDLPEDISNGETINLDYGSGIVTLPARGKEFHGEQPGEYILDIMRAGGIKPLMMNEE